MKVMISVDSFNIYILTVLDAHVCILQEPITYLNGEFYSNFLTVSISCISCSFFTTLTSWSFLEQQVQFAVSHSTTASWLQRIQAQAIYALNFAYAH